MTANLRGRTVWIGPDCGVQFADGRDLCLLVEKVEDSKYWAGMAWLSGVVIGADGLAVYVRPPGRRLRETYRREVVAWKASA